MLTCVIRYHIDPTKKAQFEEYARNWGLAIPRFGADLIGYYAAPARSPTATTMWRALQITKPAARVWPQTGLGAKMTSLRKKREVYPAGGPDLPETRLRSP
jgi:NIPSNAP